MGKILKKGKSRKQESDDEDDAPVNTKKNKKNKVEKVEKKSKKGKKNKASAKKEKVSRGTGNPVGSRELKPKAMRYALKLTDKGDSQRTVRDKIEEKYGILVNQSTICRMLADPRLKPWLKKQGV